VVVSLRPQVRRRVVPSPRPLSGSAAAQPLKPSLENVEGAARGKSWAARFRVFAKLHTLNVLDRPARAAVATHAVVTTTATEGSDNTGYGYTGVPLRLPAGGVRALYIVNRGAGALEVLLDEGAAKGNLLGVPLASGASLRREVSVAAVYARLTSGTRADLIVEQEAF